MECVQVSPTNSFLGLVEKSPKLDINTKFLYRRMNEIWQLMHQYFNQLDKQGALAKKVSVEDLTSAVMTAFVKRRFKRFQDWLEKQNEKLKSRLDFPDEMAILVQSLFLEHLMGLSDKTQDESFNAPLSHSEHRFRTTFTTCINQVTDGRLVLLFGEYLSKRWVLNLDPYTYPDFEVNLRQAMLEEVRSVDVEERSQYEELSEAVKEHLGPIQRRYSIAINWIFNDYIAATLRRIPNFYAQAETDVLAIQQFRIQQSHEKRKLETANDELQKKVKTTDEQNKRLNTLLDDLLNKCQIITAEIEQLRAQALKKMDENALGADEVIRAHTEMSKDLLQKKEQLVAQLETLTRERNDLKARLDAKGLFGGIFS